MYQELGISKKVEELAKNAEIELKEEFNKIDRICEINSLKVLKAFQDNHLSEVHFGTTTGYGYSDIGRETIEKIYSQIFKAEDSLVRNQFISGTHALTVTLFGLLRPGDTLLSITGEPYDTLHEVIGIKENNSSLKAFGVNYAQIDLIDNEFDYEKIQDTLKNNKIKVIEIQRSKGYSTRKTINIEKLEKVIKKIREVDSKVIIMVDNCYCEFVTEKEPIEVGADIAVGSLIKNLGAGIAPNGAYVVGKAELINLIAERLTSPGEGKEVGPTLGVNKQFLEGLFFAPSVVASSLKTAVLTSKIMEELGYKTEPMYNEERADIVQNIEFGNPEDLIKYCQGIQMGSPIDSDSVAEPWDMPGYADKIIMAAGAFVQGSSIELSADGPLKPPYAVYFQGGLTWYHAKLGILWSLQKLYERNLVDKSRMC